MKRIYVLILFLIIGTILSGQRISTGKTKRTERIQDQFSQAYRNNAYFETQDGVRYGLDPTQIGENQGRVTSEMVLDAGIVIRGTDGKHYRVDGNGNPVGRAIEDVHPTTTDPAGIVAAEVEQQIFRRVDETAIVKSAKKEEAALLKQLREEDDPQKKREILEEIIAFRGVISGSVVDLDGYQGIFNNIIDAINGGIPIVRRIAQYLLILITLIMIIFVAYRAFLGLEDVPLRRVFMRLFVVLILFGYINAYEKVNAVMLGFFSQPADLIAAAEDGNRDLLKTSEERSAGASNTYMNNPFKPMENYLNGILLIELELGKYEKMDMADKIVLFFGKIIGMIALMMGCLTLVIALIEFQLVALYALIIFPLGIIDRLKDWGQKAIAALCGCAIKIGMIIMLMVLFDVSMLEPFEKLLDPNLKASIFQVLSDLIISGVMFGMLITKAPAMAQTLLTGIPSLSAANFTSAAVALGTQMGLGARAVAAGATKGINAGAAIGGHVVGARQSGVNALGSVMSGIGGAMAHGARNIVNKVSSGAKASFNEGRATQMANSGEKGGGNGTK